MQVKTLSPSSNWFDLKVSLGMTSLNGVRKRRLTTKETSNGFKTRRHAFCPKQANTIEGVVLNMYKVCIWGFFFLPKQGQGFNPSAVHLYPNIGRVPAGIQSRSLVKWAIKLRTNAQGFQWIPHKSNRTEHQGQRKRDLTHYRLIIKSAMDNFPAKIKGPCWVHRYKRVLLGTGSFDGSILELLTVDRY